jgi:periplasmic divalent cation tolerance protein
MEGKEIIGAATTIANVVGRRTRHRRRPPPGRCAAPGARAPAVRAIVRAMSSSVAESPAHVVVQVTTARREEAERIARGLVEQRLAASGQVSPLRTWYRWQGQVHEADEHLVTLFTRRDRFDAIAAAVRAQHAYALPQIVALPLVHATPEFLRWIDEGCTAG